MFTYEGNLSLCYREIENRTDVETRFKIKFVDMTPGNYGPTSIKFKDKQLNDVNKFEIGRSSFLTYDTYFGDAVQKQDVSEGLVQKLDRGGNVISTYDTTTNQVSSRRDY